MKVHSKILKKMDMLGDIEIPTCSPKELRVVAERIMTMCVTPPYACPVEHSVTELDKILTVDYWEEYDGLNLEHREFDVTKFFKEWYIKEATEPDLISRARRWLYQHHYIFYEPNVAERSAEAASNFSKAVKGK